MIADRHKAVWLRMLAVKEIRFARDIGKLLKKQGKEIAKAYERGGNPSAVDASIEGEKDWYRVLIPNYAVIIRDFSAYVYEQLTQKSVKLAFSDLSIAFIEREAAEKARNLSTTTRKIMSKVIIEGEKQGLGIREIARNISKTVGGSDISKGRARTIARTETHMGAGYAMHSQASLIGYPVTKTWVSVEDERTRESHAALNNTTIPNDDYFFLEGESLLYPGDPMASAAANINCRCTLFYTPAANFSEVTYE